MAPGSHPANRWRRWVVLGMVATLIVLAVNAAMSARSPAPARELAQQSYLDRVLPIIQASTQQGRDIATVRTQALDLGVTTIGNRLQAVSTGAAQTLAQVRRLSPPASLQTGHDLLVAALAIRAEGADALRQVMAGAVSGQGSPLPVQQLVDVGHDFDAGDRAFVLFVGATPHLDVPLPSSVWLTDPSAYQAADITVFLTTLRSAASLAPVHDTSVLVVTTDPAPVAMSGTTEVLPVNKILNVQVVDDLGNQPEKHVTVMATLTWTAPVPAGAPVAAGTSTTTLPGGAGPGVSGQSVRNFVDLAPGLSRTVDLGGLHPPANMPTTLTVTVQPVPGETATADNTKVIPFVMQ